MTEGPPLGAPIDVDALPMPVAFDGGMLLVASAERLLAYNATAYHIWCALAEGRTLADIVTTLAGTFGIDRARMSVEVDAIVAHWRTEGVLDGRSRVAAPATESDEVGTPGDVEWAAYWTCRLGNRLVRFEVQDATSEALLRGLLRPLEVDRGTPETRVEVRASGGETWIVRREGSPRRRSIGHEGLKEAVYQSLIEFLWPDQPVDTLIHAGAVARGKTGLCFPAASGSGKSTLVAYLCGHGFQYLADDLTAIDRAGEVLPLPVPISLKEGCWTLLGDLFPELSSSPAFRVRQTQARLVTPSDAWNARPTPLGALIFSRYVPESGAVLQRIRPFEVLVRLREAGVWLGHPLTDDRVTRLARWLESTPAYALEYESLPAAAQHIDRIVADLQISRA